MPNPPFSSARLVILACGNPSRGDDALGPLLLQRLEQRYAGAPRITLVGDFQLQIEHALELQGQELALFVDASVSCPAPFTFTPLAPAADASHTSHALHPSAVLRVYREIHKKPPPPAFLLSIRGISFELGEALTPAASAHLEAALAWTIKLCEQPEADTWRFLAEQD
jgi:hydrogenase maturation protease